MDYKVILSPLALDDLEQIVRHVASHDPQAAERFGNRLLDHAEKLRGMPQRGAPVRARPGVRKLLLWPYLIFYRVNEQGRSVEILRFWHGAQDPKRLHFG